ncbi:MAG: hypothetical protein R2851_09255 [Caldilineaceae bacterium]
MDLAVAIVSTGGADEGVFGTRSGETWLARGWPRRAHGAHRLAAARDDRAACGQQCAGAHLARADPGRRRRGVSDRLGALVTLLDRATDLKLLPRTGWLLAGLRSRSRWRPTALPRRCWP